MTPIQSQTEINEFFNNLNENQKIIFQKLYTKAIKNSYPQKIYVVSSFCKRTIFKTIG